MLDMSPEVADVLRGSYRMRVRAEAWLDGELVAEDIPIAEGSETADITLAVPEQVTLTVPRQDRGVSWSPDHPQHPLASWGQRMRVSVGVDIRRGETEWFDRGEFLISSSGVDGESVSVNAVGLLALIDEAKLIAPFEPTGTIEATVRGLVEPALTVDVDPNLADRRVPVGLQWDEDRLAALHEVLDAWPARAAVTAEGYLAVAPDTDPAQAEPVLALTDGEGGTIVRMPGETTRDGAWNAVVASGENVDGEPVQGVIYDVLGTSPTRLGGPFNPLPVPYRYYSPLLTTAAQCRAAANTIMRRLRASASQHLQITAVPHPALQVGDVIWVRGEQLPDGGRCQITQLALPYTPGEMTMTVQVIDRG